MRKAPPPLSSATNGNLHTFPRPTDMAMQERRNSTGLDHCCLPPLSGVTSTYHLIYLSPPLVLPPLSSPLAPPSPSHLLLPRNQR
ncbi:hypothetical protein E2C01_097590 [Portunus trituberculatus]|uniref:Uncharacterized protein n=1 Tax=Portunus trituberculatus TaxID=210409 RepID=A0A5B7KBT2_PORTR|nr:hypothetical protein [Portunus trituberculatus]